MTTNDILNFATKNNISITKNEAIVIYNYIKSNYKSLLDGNESSLKDLKDSLSEDLYNEIIKLYMHYKNKLF